MTADHLISIDAAAWPAVAQAPTLPIVGGALARAAEARFARAARKAGLTFGREGDLTINHEEFFDRIAAAGWTGVAESYMAGEWESTRLASVLARLIRVGYSPRTPRRLRTESAVGELPPELIHLYAGDGMSTFGGVFAASVPTTVRVPIKNYSMGAGKGDEPEKRMIDVRTYDAPHAVERDDLSAGQTRTAELLLDAAGVRAGSTVLDFPASGGAVALAGARREAHMTALTGDVDVAKIMRRVARDAGIEDRVSVTVRDSVLSGAPEWRTHYDAVICVEKLESLGTRQQIKVAQGIDRMVHVGGRAVILTTIATDKMTTAGRHAIRMLGEYIYAGQNYPTIEELYQLFDRRTSLRVISQSHVGTHTKESLDFEAQNFAAHERDAAAQGFDHVYRRLWDYQFALRRALFELGMLDTVILTLAHRHRDGRR